MGCSYRKIFRTGYQPRTNIVQAQESNLPADSQQYFEHMKESFLSVIALHRANDVWQTATHAAEPLLPEPIVSEADMADQNLKDTNRRVFIKVQQN